MRNFSETLSGEPLMMNLLHEKFPKAEYVEVRDISGNQIA